MLKPRKKITKKQLKEDPVLTQISKIEMFLEENWQKLAIGAAVLLLVYFTGTYMQSASMERDQAAAGELYPIELQYFGANYDEALISGLEGVIERHGSTPSGATATFYLANSLFFRGEYPRAEETFKKYLADYDGPDFMKASALNGIAACYEQRELNNDAVTYYKQTLSMYSSEFISADSYLGLARVLIKMGNLEEAKGYCDEVLERFPNTQHAANAEILLAQI